MGVKFGHIEIFVKDPLRSRDFYTNTLGFEHIETQGDKYVWLKLNGTEILLRPRKTYISAENYQSANMAIVIYTDNVEETVKQYTSAGLILKGNDGENNPTFTDPDGNWFQIANPNS